MDQPLPQLHPDVLALDAEVAAPLAERLKVELAS
jgi:hypothetical protein